MVWCKIGVLYFCLNLFGMKYITSTMSYGHNMDAGEVLSDLTTFFLRTQKKNIELYLVFLV